MPGAVAALARLGVDPARPHPHRHPVPARRAHRRPPLRGGPGARGATDRPARRPRRARAGAGRGRRPRPRRGGRAGRVLRLVRGDPGTLAPGVRRPALDGAPPGRPRDAPPPARPAVRGAPPLPGGAVDRPRRGALGPLRRGVRDPGGRGRRRRRAPGSGPPRLRPDARLVRRPAPATSATRNGSAPPGAPARCTSRASTARPGACAWSGTRRATSTR